MKIPYFEESGEGAPRKDKETIKRKNVTVMLEHPSDKKYMLLHWEKFGWKTFIIGGVEGEESYEEAGIREVIEETGYDDIESTRKILGKMTSSFYAAHKGVNRLSEDEYVFVKLKSLNRIETDEEETQFHTALWVEKSEVEDFLNVDSHLYAWYLFVNNKKEDHEYLETLGNFKGFKK